MTGLRWLGPGADIARQIAHAESADEAWEMACVLLLADEVAPALAGLFYCGHRQGQFHPQARRLALQHRQRLEEAVGLIRVRLIGDIGRERWEAVEPEQDWMPLVALHYAALHGIQVHLPVQWGDDRPSTWLLEVPMRELGITASPHPVGGGRWRGRG